MAQRISVSGVGRYSTATYRLQTRFPGLAFTVQTRGWVFDRAQIEARIGKVTNGEFAQIMRRYNELRAEELQAALAQALEEGRVASRRDVSTGRLEWALLHKNNRIVRPFGFGVGVPSWLDRSRAKYWRQIDEGYWGHVGREIWGVWGEGPPRIFRGRYTGSGPYTAHGANRRGALVPRVPSNEYAAARAGLGPAISARPRRTTIERPIEAQKYFERAWEKVNMREAAMDDLRSAIAEVLDIGFDEVRL